MYSRPVVLGNIVLAFVVAAAFLWRPLAALSCDNFGNLALAKGDEGLALDWFNRGVALSPQSRVLLEDRGKALLRTDPLRALADFQAANCGATCLQGEGDAHMDLGDFDAATHDYIAARSVTRLTYAISRLARAGRFDDAISAERALAARFSDNALDQAELARAMWQIGRLEELAAYNRPPFAKRYRVDAIRVLTRAAAIAPYNEGYLLELGHAEMQWGDRGVARRTFERLLELHPHQSDAERALQQLNARPPHSAAR